LAGGLVRRINIIQRQLLPESDIEAMPIGMDYLVVQNSNVESEQSDLYNDIYLAYVDWSHSLVDLAEEKKTPQTQSNRNQCPTPTAAALSTQTSFEADAGS
jgi:hypothetical protein